MFNKMFFKLVFVFVWFFGRLIATAMSPVELGANAGMVWWRRRFEFDSRNLTVPRFKCGSFGTQPAAQIQTPACQFA